MACVLLLVLALAGCGSDNSKQDAAAAAAARAHAKAVRQARLVSAGRPLFTARCGICHTIEGRTAHPTFIESPIPDLNEVQPRERYIRDRIAAGGIDMPSLTGELSQAEIDKVVAYVLAVGGTRVAKPDADAQQLRLGANVFRENCQRCHGIDGRRRTGRPLYGGTDFNDVKPSERLVMQQALRGIPEAMPSFRGRLTRAQLQAVAAYVTTTAGE
jgi:cbb3-type cytochrome c oxidase subunit III